MKKLLYALLIALLFTGCAKQKEVQIPSTDRKEALLAVLFDGISLFSTEIALDCSAEELRIAFAELLCRRADLFYISSQYRYRVQSGGIVLYPAYTMAREEADAFRTILEDRADELCGDLDQTRPIAERALLLHDRLLREVEYDPKHRFPLADALLAGYADCEGYARSYQFLLQRCGIEARFVIGRTADGGHAWVLFCDEDGIWYHTDPTWDDGAFLSRAYFMQDDSIMRRTHTIDSADVSYPGCSGQPHRFYRENGLCAAEESVTAAFDHAAAWKTGAAEFCFPKGVSLAELAVLDEQVKAEARRGGIVLTERITAKNSMVVSYRFG